MTTRRTLSPSSVLFALFLIAALLGVAWLSLRTAIVEIMPPADPRAAALAPSSPDVVLTRALVEFVLRRGALSPETGAQVDRAAQRAPLDARPFLFAGARDILRRDNSRAVATLEAGRRLDGRQRWIRLLLLDRYLRNGRYDDAAGELTIINRLVTGAQAPILGELARMTQDPATRVAVQRALARDPGLEADLLTTLAKSNPDPDLIVRLASPAARAQVRQPDSWGQALIEGMVAQGRFDAARATWANLFGVAPAAAKQLLYDADLRPAPGLPPFAWDLASGTVGAADQRNGQLEVNYYGRDDGALASQLLVLAPGRYRLGYTLTGSAGAGLSWTLSCAERPKGPPVGGAPLPPASSAARRYAVTFTVPAGGCRAQWLRLAGTATEFPTPVNVTISGLSLQRSGPTS